MQPARLQSSHGVGSPGSVRTAGRVLREVGFRREAGRRRYRLAFRLGCVGREIGCRCPEAFECGLRCRWGSVIAGGFGAVPGLATLYFRIVAPRVAGTVLKLIPQLQAAEKRLNFMAAISDKFLAVCLAGYLQAASSG